MKNQGGKNPRLGKLNKGGLTTVVKGQENGTRILLGLKDYEVGGRGQNKVIVSISVKEEERKCPYCGSARLYRHGMCKPREVLHAQNNGRRVYPF